MHKLRTVPPITSAHPFCASRETLPRARPRVSPDAYSLLTSVCKKNTPQRAVYWPFYPKQRYIYPFSVFQTTSTLLVAHILNLAWLRCGLDRQKSCPLLEKKWLFSVLFSLKITADLQNKLSGRVHVMTDNLLWNPKNIRDWSCFPFCAVWNICLRANRFFQVKVSPF